MDLRDGGSLLHGAPGCAERRQLPADAAGYGCGGCSDDPLRPGADRCEVIQQAEEYRGRFSAFGTVPRCCSNNRICKPARQPVGGGRTVCPVTYPDPKRSSRAADPRRHIPRAAFQAPAGLCPSDYMHAAQCRRKRVDKKQELILFSHVLKDERVGMGPASPQARRLHGEKESAPEQRTAGKRGKDDGNGSDYVQAVRKHECRQAGLYSGQKTCLLPYLRSCYASL